MLPVHPGRHSTANDVRLPPVGSIGSGCWCHSPGRSFRTCRSRVRPVAARRQRAVHAQHDRGVVRGDDRAQPRARSPLQRVGAVVRAADEHIALSRRVELQRAAADASVRDVRRLGSRLEIPIGVVAEIPRIAELFGGVVARRGLSAGGRVTDQCRRERLPPGLRRPRKVVEYAETRGILRGCRPHV